MPDLSKIFPPFAALPSPLLARLRVASVRSHVAKGGVVFEEGADAKAIYLVATGRLILQRQAPGGSARTVCHLCPRGLACCVTALDREPYPATAIAALNSKLLRVPCSLFAELLETQPGFARAALQQIGRQLRLFTCDGAPLGDAGARIASKILSALLQFGEDVPLTRREIAEMAGTAVETAIRETRGFEEAGWIALQRSHIRVLDSEALRLRAKEQCPRGRAKLPSRQVTPLAVSIEDPPTPDGN